MVSASNVTRRVADHEPAAKGHRVGYGNGVVLIPTLSWRYQLSEFVAGIAYGFVGSISRIAATMFAMLWWM